MLYAPTGVTRHPIENRAQSSQVQWSLAEIYDVIRWRRSIIIFSLIAVLAAALVYVIATPARFTAVAVLMTDTKRAPAYGSDGASDNSVDMVVVESQVETLKSDRIALAVIDKLRLWQDPEFVGKGPTLWSFIRGLFSNPGAKRPNTQDVKRQIAAGNFKRALQVQRAGRSYVSEISFTSLDPNKAAAVANAIAQAYIVDQLSAKLQIAQRSSDWIENRIGELRVRASDAAKAVDEFKAANNGAADTATIHPAGDQQANGTLQRLRQLEAAAQSARTTYETFFNRYTQSIQIQQQSFPVTEARVLAEAVPPLSKSAPKSSLILLLALVAGGTLGLIGAFAREYFERLVRTPRQLERELGVRVLGLLPTVKRRRSLLSRGGPLNLIEAGRPSRFARTAPLSLAGESVRGLKVALDRNGTGDERQVVGISSPRPGAGKTTLAYNLALLTARCGRRTLLIDGDLRHSTLTKYIAPQQPYGLAALLRGEAESSSCIVEHIPNLHFLGATPHATDHPSDVLGSGAMAATLEGLRQAYDYIIIDLPPVLDCVEVRASAPMISSFILVLEWGRTSIEDVCRALGGCDVVLERLLGVAVNRISPTELVRRY
jgi:succinoglycan biosynthesis transport protein ExoP